MRAIKTSGNPCSVTSFGRDSQLYFDVVGTVRHVRTFVCAHLKFDDMEGIDEGRKYCVPTYGVVRKVCSPKLARNIETGKRS